MTNRSRIIGLLCLLPALLTVCPAPPAHAAGTVVDVVVDRLAPLIPSSGQTLRVGGRLVNSSRDTLGDVRVRLLLSSVVITRREQIDSALQAGAEEPWDRSQDYVLDWSREVVADSLGAGAQASFSLSIPFDKLPLGADGVYVVGVEALAAGDQGSQRVGLARTFLPWFPSPVGPVRSEMPYVNVAWMWPLTDQPARTANGALLDDRTPISMSPGGRLQQLVELGAERPSLVSWVVDPALLQTAAQIADGYLVEQDGTFIAGDRAQQAAAWLDLVRSAVTAGSAQAMAYADIDATAALRADLPNDVVRAVTSASPIASQALERPIPGGLAWPADGHLDRQTANLLASAGNSTVVLVPNAGDPLPTGSAPPQPGIATYGTPSGSMLAIIAEPRITATLAMPQRTASEVLSARQRFLAETGLLAQLSSAPVTIVAAPADVQWAPSRKFAAPALRATSEAPWIRPASLESLLALPRSAVVRPQAQRGGGLPDDYLERVRRATDRMGRLASVLQDPGPVTDAYAAALLRAQSTAWRDDLSVGERLIRSINSGLADETSKVRVLSSGDITFSGDTGKVPVTVVNETGQTVNVGLALLASPGTRLSAEPAAGIVIEPGRKVSVDITARVIGSDPLPVRVQLLTPEGERYGVAGTITVRSTAYARVASWVVVAAFIALAIFVVVGIVQRIRRARRGPVRSA